MEKVIYDEKELIKLRENLVEVINEYKHKPETELSKKLKRGLKDFNFLPGKVQTIIKDINEEAYNLTEQELYVVSQQVHVATGQSKVDPNKYYPERMAKEIKTNFEVEIDEKIDFPYTIKGVIQIEEDDYIVKMKASEIKALFESSMIQYNTETQREARQIRSKSNPEVIIEVPKLVERSVKEIEELFEKGELISSVLTFNARLGSSDEGEELIYNESDRTLTITEGTLLDSLDGFHRINGIVRALRKNPSLDKTFKINILNFSKTKAKRFFGQINTTNPISKSRLEEANQRNWAAFVTEQLKYESELKGRMSGSDSIAPGSNLLVTFTILTEAIDELFDIQDKPSALKVSNYLANFIEKLFYAFPDEFMSNIAETRKTSLINANSMFYGYICLAKRMKDENISLDKLSKIINSIDFDKKNKLWTEINVLDSSQYIRGNSKKQICKYFNDLKLN